MPRAMGWPPVAVLQFADGGLANGMRLTYVSPHRCVGLEERVGALERDIAHMRAS